MCAHLRLAVEREEAPQQLKYLGEGDLWDACVHDVEKAALCTRGINLFRDGLPLCGRAIYVGDVNGRNRCEACGFLGHLAVCCLRAGVEVYIFTTVLLWQSVLASGYFVARAKYLMTHCWGGIVQYLRHVRRHSTEHAARK